MIFPESSKDMLVNYDNNTTALSTSYTTSSHSRNISHLVFINTLDVSSLSRGEVDTGTIRCKMSAFGVNDLIGL